ncbi:MAG: PAS domain S-box protein [Bacteroidetes bacterium]|jgi:PAS domain S-box-containing protein|nr:PAS domain S-box protein [Bacteroidota bacterium]
MGINLYFIDNTGCGWNKDELVNHKLIADHSINCIPCSSIDDIMQPAIPHIILLTFHTLSEVNAINPLFPNVKNIILCCEEDDQPNQENNLPENIYALFIGTHTKVKEICVAIRNCANTIELKASENYEILNEALNKSPYGIQIANNQGIITFHNQAHKQIFHYQQDDVSRKYVWDLIHDPNEKHEYKKYYQAIIAHETEPGVYFIHDLLPDGNVIITQHVWNYVKNKNNQVTGIFSIISDRTEQVEAEQNLEASEERNRTLIDQLPEALVVHKQGIVVFINPIAIKLLGGREEDYIGKSVLQFIAEEYHELVKQRLAISKQSTKPLPIVEEKLIKSNGETMDVEITSVPIRFENEDCSLVMLRDITEHKRIQKELIESKEKAEEADSLKSAFLANMSHEIRTPMNGIIGFSDMLKQPGLDHDKRLYYTDIIKKSCHQLLTIINDIVDISKIESGQVEVYPENTNINEVMNELYKLFQPLAESKKIDLSVSNELPDHACVAHTDTVRLKQVLNNLLGNAFKFTKEGRIVFGYQIKPEAIWFFVEDTGIGIHEKNISVIFERFRQLEMNATRNYGGNGLGLSISKALVEKLGGNIWVHSTLSKGSTFYFSIPYENQPIKMETKKQQESLADTKITHKTILVAEDEDINFLFIKEIFSDSEIEIIRAINGKEAVDMIRENKSISLVLMDIKMPVMDGYEATKQIKSIRNNLPILAQTAYAMSGDKEKALNAGCDDYISKPIKKHEILNKVKEYI